MPTIREWLDGLGLAEFADAFAAERIEFEDLTELTEGDLKDIGLPIGPRRRVLKALRALSADGETAPAETPAAASPDPVEESAPTAPAQAERRQITVMFCDLVGSTALSEQLDPEDLRAVIAAYRRAAAGVIERYDGHIAQYLGDGLMVYFGWPRAHEDDAPRAVRAGREVVSAVAALDGEAALAVRIGIATGLVVVGEGDADNQEDAKLAIGETPNLAARIQALAEPNQVAIAPTTRRLIGDAFELEDLGPHRIKGLTEQANIYRVLDEVQAESRFEATQAAGRMTRLIGRDSELSLLGDRWTRAKDGDGQVVLLSGEPGIGKSRIIEAFRETIKDEPHTRLRYQCSPYHVNSALYPAINQIERAAGFERDDTPDQKLDKLDDLLALSADDVADIAPYFVALLSLPEGRYPPLDLPPQIQRERTIGIFVEQTVALSRGQPVLMIFEDVHWIDPSTLEFLKAAVDGVQDAAVLIVVMHRPEFEASWAGFGHVTTLALNRLSRGQGADIVAAITGGKPLPDEVMTQIVAKTDGVPLFVEELTKTVLEAGILRDTGTAYELDGPLPPLAIPATLQDSLMARLDRLSPVKEIAQIGACIGREFGHDLLNKVAPLSDNELRDAIEQLVDHELIFARGTPPTAQYTFKHALIQDTAYESLLKARRHQIHVQIAEALTAHFTDQIETEPEIVAHHYTAAGLADQAAKWWKIAGRRAADHFAHAEAVTHFSAGLDAIATIEDGAEQVRREIDLSLDLVSSLRILGRYQDALAALERAESLAVGDEAAIDLARICYLRGNIYFPLGDFESCRASHSKALDLAKRAGSAELQARALGGLADAAYLQGRMVTAFENFDQCVGICRSHGFDEIEAGILPMRGWGRYYQKDVRGGLEDCLAGVDRAAGIGDLRAEMLSRLAACCFLWEVGDFEALAAQCEIALEVTRRLGARNFEPFQLFNRALMLDADNKAEALRLAQDAVAICRETGPAFVGPWSLGVLALISDDRAQRRDALGEGARLLESGCVGHNYLWFYRHAMDAALKWREWDRVEDYAAALERYTAAEPLPASKFFVARARALAAHAAGPSNRAVCETIRDLSEQAARGGFTMAKRGLDAALAGESVES